MDMSGERRIPATRERVWEALNDPEILRLSIPGCQEIEKVSETEITAKVTTKIGPMSAKFSGKVELSDIDPPNGYTLSGEGQGGVAGFAKGSAKVRLQDDGGETLLKYDVNATVGGKMAQLGTRLIDTTTRKLTDQFFENFANAVVTPAEAPAEAAPAPAGGIPQWAWVGGLIVIVLLLLAYFGDLI